MNGESSSEKARVREFVALLGQYDRRLQAFILALVPHFADAEEIAQQVRLLLWEQFDQYDRTKDFGVWARTVAYYRILAFRKQSKRRHASLSQECIDALANPAEGYHLDADQHYEALLDCLHSLDAEKRELLICYYANPSSMRDLAEKLGRSFHAVRHSLLRTRTALSDCIARRLRREEAP